MQTCFKCGKLTGPPYINPRFKPYRQAALVKSDYSLPRLHKIINASAPHESTGSTVALSCITEDLGSDIFVLIKGWHTMAAKDYSKPFEDEPVKPQIQIHFDEGDEGSMILEGGNLESESELEGESVIGEVGDLESVDNLEFESESESGSQEVSRKRTTASDSDDSDSDDGSEMDKMSAQGSEPDSGIGTGSHVGSGTVSSSASEYSICDQIWELILGLIAEFFLCAKVSYSFF